MDLGKNDLAPPLLVRNCLGRGTLVLLLRQTLLLLLRQVWEDEGTLHVLIEA